MKKGFFQILTFLFCVTSSVGSAKPVSFKDILPIHKSQVLGQLPSLRGQNVSPSDLDLALENLMLTESYENIVVRDQPTTYLIEGIPLKKVGLLKFEGASVFSKQELLTKTELATGSRFDPKTLTSAGQKLKALYGESGYYNTVIEIIPSQGVGQTVNLLFKIQEGSVCRIVRLEFDSKNQDLNQSLFDRFDSYESRPLSSLTVDSLRKDVEKWLLKHDYLNSKVDGPKVDYNKERTQSVVRFEVTHPFEYRVSIQGIQKYQGFYEDPSLFKHQKIPRAFRKIPSESTLKAHLKSEEPIPSVNPETALSLKIKNYFLNHGYPKVNVQSSSQTESTDFVKSLMFKVDAGPQVEVSEWALEGKISRPESTYIDFMIENSTPLLQDGFFHREGFELGQENLITHLRNQGYLKTRIQSSRVEYHGRFDQFAKLTVVLDEGPLTQIRKISFQGAKAFSSKELADVFEIKNNTPLRLNEVQNSLDSLREFYLSRGYLDMEFRNSKDNLVRYSDKGTQAFIDLKIYEGPQVTAKTILVEGNTFTDQDVVLRSLSFSNGDIITPEKIESSIARINRMGIFSRVTIQFLEEGTRIGDRTVLVSIEERDPGLWRLGVGVNSQRELTARTFSGVSYNNLFGTGRGLSLRGELSSNIADINYLEHRLNVSYLEPFLFGTKMTGRLNLIRSDEVFNVDDSADLVNILTKNSFNLLVESQLSRQTTLTWTVWSLESRTSRERDGFCLDPDAVEGSRCDDESQQVGLMGPVLDVDYRDSTFLPTRGTYSRLGIDYANPNLGSSEGIEFARFDGLFRYYIPMAKVVWANEIRSGYLANLSDAENSGVPASYAFFLGGYSTVRGFDFTEEENRIPRGRPTSNPPPGVRTFLPVQNATDLLISSDSYYYMVKTELRFPIYGDFGGVIFYDGGAVLVSGYDFLDPYRDSLGFGFRINTPVGPVAADLGFKLDKKDGEEAFDFHFSIGTF